jgi:hypothetical protein
VIPEEKRLFESPKEGNVRLFFRVQTLSRRTLTIECGYVPCRKQLRMSALIARKVDKVNGMGDVVLLMLIRLLVLGSPDAMIDEVVAVVACFGLLSAGVKTQRINTVGARPIPRQRIATRADFVAERVFQNDIKLRSIGPLPDLTNARSIALECAPYQTLSPLVVFPRMCSYQTLSICVVMRVAKPYRP